MKQKRKTIILLFVIVSILIGIIGFTYAWYDANKVSVNISSPIFNVNYLDTDVLNVTTDIPMTDEEALAGKGSATKFQVKGDFSTTSTDLKKILIVKLNNVIIDSVLKTSSKFKYIIRYSGSPDYIKGCSGNFSTFSGNTYLVCKLGYTNTISSINENMELRIWISDDGTDQGFLMGKTFSANVSVNVYYAYDYQ